MSIWTWLFLVHDTACLTSWPINFKIMLKFNELDIPQNCSFAFSPKGIQERISSFWSFVSIYWSCQVLMSWIIYVWLVHKPWGFVSVLLESIGWWVQLVWNLYYNWLIVNLQTCNWVWCHSIKHHQKCIVAVKHSHNISQITVFLRYLVPACTR